MLEVLYTCALCGLRDATVSLAYRESSEDVVEWMEGKVTPALVADHARRSPDCRPETLANVKIPHPPGTEWIGGPVKQ